LKKVAVIGAGISGIASAIRLAVRGFDVTVFEINENPGGKINQIEYNGFRFDTGPSLFTLPELVDELFMLSGSKYTLQYTQLEEACQYFYEDGMVINAYIDLEKFNHELTEKLGEDNSALKRYLKKSEELYKLTSRVFIFKSIHLLRNYFSMDFLKSALKSYKLNAFQTMHAANLKRFKNPKTIQLFDRYATYNGSNPYKAPGTLNIIAHLENNLGAFFPDKGMYNIVEELVKLAELQGVKFNYKAKVESLLINNSVVEGVKVNGQDFFADFVVNSTDVNNFYKFILKDHTLLKQTLQHEKSSSAIIFYWGINHAFENVHLHNILFAENYQEEFEYLFDKKMIYHDPTVYIFVSAKQVPTDAPQGKENWFVMINAPENVGQNWESCLQEARKNMVQKINRMLKTDIEQYIEFEHVASPVTIENTTASYHGSLYGNSSNDMFAAFNRHANFSRKYNGLYFTGGSVHPGGGIPLCLASAKIATDILLHHDKR